MRTTVIRPISFNSNILWSLFLCNPKRSLLDVPCCERTGLQGFRPADTNRAVQLQKMARSLKFQI